MKMPQDQFGSDMEVVYPEIDVKEEDTTLEEKDMYSSEDVEDSEDNDVVDDDLEDDDSETEEEEVSTPDNNVALKEDAKAIKFTEEQQRFLNSTIEDRLARQKRSAHNSLIQAAGIALEEAEVPQAARLWGLLKNNPELSTEINVIINRAINVGKAKPTAPTVADKYTARESALALKEAVLDLKGQDKVFNKYSQTVLDWAEEEGFSVTDNKSLNMAYKAWKGDNSEKFARTKEKSVVSKTQFKSQQVKAASTKAPTTKATRHVNVSKMSDAEYLASQGIKLFTED